MVHKKLYIFVVSIPKKLFRLLASFPGFYFKTILSQSAFRAVYAGPRLRHAGSGLDMCYVSETTPTIIALSRPSSTLPLSLFCNPTSQLLEHLGKYHPTSTHVHLVFNLRGETPGYLDSELYPARVHHAPWPDHHPPPMNLLLSTVSEMNAFFAFEQDDRKKIALVHCKAGKGRSGTLISAYFVAHENKTAMEAMGVFTTKRMRIGFGEGVSIKSQRRYVNYMEQWVIGMQRRYVERKVKVTTVSVWGLKGDVEVSVVGYTAVESCSRGTWEIAPLWRARGAPGKRTNVVWHPNVEAMTGDICLGVQRWAGNGWIKICKTRAWFNAVMEAAKRDGDSQQSGRFEIPWEEMDGLKGTAIKGRRAFERCVVDWEFVEQGDMEIARSIDIMNDGEIELADDITIIGDSGDEGGKLMCSR
ncbi:phosphatases II [Terfezia boudieri ATCC MYA-4762]|uniref:phosphatidylinositol-3,4,5-trisphosphate 3-phosphatase n=1 Tax=Terfezia boudieri ATCC MYA-4762 TaxID=1051890 RepID=A0A3N4LGG7_9PEZI|nr:phosphatases II [Terfezia boudieri ATCC MYA-4762]